MHLKHLQFISRSGSINDRSPWAAVGGRGAIAVAVVALILLEYIDASVSVENIIR